MGTAVHEGDLDVVLDRHAAEIVMFDVPPPEDGVRGIDAYRATWPPFFDWQRQGAVFEITELDVTAGDDVAFAHTLLRCGAPVELDAEPAKRLRLTVRAATLRRRVDGRPRAPLVHAVVTRSSAGPRTVTP